MAEAASSSASLEEDHYCHTCERRIHAVFHPRDEDQTEDDDQPTCPRCGDCFVEKLEQEDDQPLTHTPAHVTSSFSSTTASVSVLPPPSASATTPTPSPPIFGAPGFSPAPVTFQQVFYGNGMPGGFQMIHLSNPFTPIAHSAQTTQTAQGAAGSAVHLQMSPPSSAAPQPSAGGTSSSGVGEQLLPAYPQQPFPFGLQPLFPQLAGPTFAAPLAHTATAHSTPTAGPGPGLPQTPQQVLPPSQQQQQQQVLPHQLQMNLNPFVQLFQPLMQAMMPPSVPPQAAAQPPPFFPFGASPGGGGGGVFNPFGLLQQVFGGLQFGGGMPGGQHPGDFFFGDMNQLLHNLMMQGSGRLGSPPAAASTVAALQDITLDADSIRSNANTDCSVCLEVFQIGDVVKRLPCKHAFHGDCLLPWLREHNSCPTCRFLLPTDDPAYEQRRAHAAQAVLEQSAQAAAAASSSASTTASSSAPSSSSSSSVGPAPSTTPSAQPPATR